MTGLYILVSLDSTSGVHLGNYLETPLNSPTESWFAFFQVSPARVLLEPVSPCSPLAMHARICLSGLSFQQDHAFEFSHPLLFFCWSCLVPLWVEVVVVFILDLLLSCFLRGSIRITTCSGAAGVGHPLAASSWNCINATDALAIAMFSCCGLALARSVNIICRPSAVTVIFGWMNPGHGSSGTFLSSY